MAYRQNTDGSLGFGSNSSYRCNYDCNRPTTYSNNGFTYQQPYSNDSIVNLSNRTSSSSHPPASRYSNNSSNNNYESHQSNSNSITLASYYDYNTHSTEINYNPDKSDYRLIKEGGWDDKKHFMEDYGLRIWNPEDHEEAGGILDRFRMFDAQEAEYSRSGRHNPDGWDFGELSMPRDEDLDGFTLREGLQRYHHSSDVYNQVGERDGQAFDDEGCDSGGLLWRYG